MGLIGDKTASLHEYHRVVTRVLPVDMATAVLQVISALGPAPKAPWLGSKLFITAHEADLVVFSLGNKSSGVWNLSVDFTALDDKSTEIKATCTACLKGKEYKNFLHKTLKPYLDVVETLGTAE